ncbi:YceI family protein [Simplicispira psychrophila]|uniref:YceI family protein n=1 Tax=Simplicispira psychrophila TaxID=80882 RepID=UPI000489A642|nr:YceI family protein [Simplicispira psychrophila]
MQISSIVSALLLTSASLLAVQPALAQQKLAPADSQIGFTTRQMGVPLEGHFKKFDAQVTFNPAQLASSHITVTVDTASATLGAPESDAEMPKATWFNVPQFPQATFQSSSIKALGGGKFEVAGKLSIKGIARDVVAPVTLVQNGANTTATGTLTLQRLTYKIGENEWADTSMVANDVQVKFKLVLTGIAKL